MQWDTNILLECIDRAPYEESSAEVLDYRKRMREAVLEMLSEAQSKQIKIVISAMAIAEAAHADRSVSPEYEKQTRLVEDFLRHEWFARVPVDIAVAHRARRIRLAGGPEFKMTNEDLVQVSTAAEYSIPEFITSDGDWADPVKKARREKKGLLKFTDTIELADKSGRLKIWTPLERREDKQKREAELQAQRKAQAEQRAAEEKRKAEKEAEIKEADKGPRLF